MFIQSPKYVSVFAVVTLDGKNVANKYEELVDYQNLMCLPEHRFLNQKIYTVYVFLLFVLYIICFIFVNRKQELNIAYIENFEIYLYKFIHNNNKIKN
jgi:hypothetical protein